MNALLALSFVHAKDILNMELDPDHRNFSRVLAAKQAMATSVFSASVRVDAASMRKQTNDRLGEIIDLVKQAKRDRTTL